MAFEPFLINPYRSRRQRRRVSGRVNRRRRTRGLPSALLRRMMRTYGTKRGMKEAWKLYRQGYRRNVWADDTGGHRLAALKGWKRRRTTSARRRRRRNPWEQISYPARSSVLWRVKRTGRFGSHARRNPYGEEVMIVGANPRRRRKRIRRFSDNFDNPRWRQVRSRVRSQVLRRRRFRDNPRRRTAGVPALSFRRPMSLVVPIAVGTAAFVLTDRVPAMVGVTATWQKYGAKAAVGVGGSMLVGKFLGRTQGIVWLLGSGINIATDLVKQFLLPRVSAPVAGYGAFPYAYDYGEPRGIGYEGYQAFPDEMAAGGYPFAGTIEY